jgi:hypothetical protein
MLNMKKNNRVQLTEIQAFSQGVLFKQLWIMSNRRSFLSGLWLRDHVGGPQFPAMFAHMLPKGQNQYPHFGLYVKNVRLLTPTEHGLLDQGTEEERIAYSKEVKTADWSRITDLQEELKEEYKKYFPATYSGIINYKYSPEEVGEILGKINREFWLEMEKSRGSDT